MFATFWSLTYCKLHVVIAFHRLPSRIVIVMALCNLLLDLLINYLPELLLLLHFLQFCLDLLIAVQLLQLDCLLEALMGRLDARILLELLYSG